MYKSLSKKIKNLIHTIKADPYRALIFIAILYPFFLFLNNIISGSIPFWYDPARDFLLALDNQKAYSYWSTKWHSGSLLWSLLDMDDKFWFDHLQRSQIRSDFN